MFKIVLESNDIAVMVRQFNNYLLQSSDSQMESRKIAIDAMERFFGDMPFEYLTSSDMQKSQRGSISGVIVLGNGEVVILDGTRRKIKYEAI